MAEEKETTLVFMSGSSRIILMLGIIISIASQVSNMFLTKEIDFILSHPISRTKFFLTYVFANIIVSLITIMFIIMMIACISDINNYINILLWGYSICIESIIVIFFVTTVSLIYENVIISILSSIAFYSLSRIIGFFVIISNNDISMYHSSVNTPIILLLKFLSLILPRLDLFSKSQWLIYDSPNITDISIMSLQAIIYIPLIISIALYDIHKKRF